MSSDPTTKEIEPLGTFLRNKRREKRLDKKTLINETKIPPKTLEAIENDDFSALPAEAFARGFYSLYAKSLELDPEQILRRYEKVRGLPPRKNYETTTLQGDSKPVNSLAARPPVSLTSLLGFALVMAIFILGGICWYFSWNPATFLSEQLRSFQKSSTQEEMKQEEAPAEKKEDKKKKNLSMSLGPRAAFAAPLVVMSGKEESYTRKNGVVFITIPAKQQSEK